jgi:hypothetical protein
VWARVELGIDAHSGGTLMVTELAGPRIWVNTDPLWVGHDLQADNSSPLDQLWPGLVRRYQLHFEINSILGYERLNVDQLGAGILGFHSAPNGLNPRWGNHLDGLTISIDRPPQLPPMTPVNHFAAINVATTLFNATGVAFLAQGRFVLVGTFRRPIQQPLSGFVDGDWASALLLETISVDPVTNVLETEAQLRGVTCQFRPTGTRMNLPATESHVNRPNLPDSAVTKITDPVNPSPFTLILSYNSFATPTGSAFLLVDQEIVDSVSFDFAAMQNVRRVNNVLMGVGAVNGGGFTAQVDLIDVQIWVPPFPHV